jgi:hypothetical protein
MWLRGKYYVSLDTEFIAPNLSSTGTLSIGLATEEHSIYAVNADMDVTMEGLNADSKEWMRKNVWPHLPGGSPEKFDRSHSDVMAFKDIAVMVEEFFNEVMVEVGHDIDKVVLFAHCGAQDMVRLHGLWGQDWSAMPRVIPNWVDDVKRMRLAAHLRTDQLPEQVNTPHHALCDAVHELDAVRFIIENDPNMAEELI